MVNCAYRQCYGSDCAITYLSLPLISLTIHIFFLFKGFSLKKSTKGQRGKDNQGKKGKGNQMRMYTVCQVPFFGSVPVQKAI